MKRRAPLRGTRRLHVLAGGGPRDLPVCMELDTQAQILKRMLAEDPAAKAAVTRYVMDDDAYRPLNQELRHQAGLRPAELSDEVAQVLRGLTRALDMMAPLVLHDHYQVLYRCGYVPDDFGGSFTDHGFVSTSTSESEALNFCAAPGTTLMVIHLLPGVEYRVLNLNWTGEEEVILKPGCVFHYCRTEELETHPYEARHYILAPDAKTYKAAPFTKRCEELGFINAAAKARRGGPQARARFLTHSLKCGLPAQPPEAACEGIAQCLVQKLADDAPCPVSPTQARAGTDAEALVEKFIQAYNEAAPGLGLSAVVSADDRAKMLAMAKAKYLSCAVAARRARPQTPQQTTSAKQQR